MTWLVRCGCRVWAIRPILNCPTDTRLCAPSRWVYTLIVDVGVRTDPHQHVAVCIALSVSAAEMPAVDTICPAEAMLELERLAGVDGVAPATDVLLDII